MLINQHSKHISSILMSYTSSVKWYARLLKCIFQCIICVVFIYFCCLELFQKLCLLMLEHLSFDLILRDFMFLVIKNNAFTKESILTLFEIEFFLLFVTLLQTMFNFEFLFIVLLFDFHQIISVFLLLFSFFVFDLLCDFLMILLYAKLFRFDFLVQF